MTKDAGLDYDTLVSQHESIASVIRSLLALLQSAEPQPDEASRMLDALATLLRDHLAVEDPVIYETLILTRDTRHDEAAMLSAQELDALKDDWMRYLSRWNKTAIAANWVDFVEISRAMLGRVRERVERETAILYSLAVHYAVLEQRD